MPETQEQQIEQTIAQINKVVRWLQRYNANPNDVNPILLQDAVSSLLNGLHPNLKQEFRDILKRDFPQSPEYVFNIANNEKYRLTLIRYLNGLSMKLSARTLNEKIRSNTINPDTLKQLVEKFDEFKVSETSNAARSWRDNWLKQIKEYNRQQIYKQIVQEMPDTPHLQAESNARAFMDAGKTAVDEAKKEPATRQTIYERLRNIEHGLPPGYSDPQMKKFLDIAVAAAIAEKEEYEISQEAAYIKAKLEEELRRANQQAELAQLSERTEIVMSQADALAAEMALDQHIRKLFGEAANHNEFNEVLLAKYGFSISIERYNFLSQQAEHAFINTHLPTTSQPQTVYENRVIRYTSSTVSQPMLRQTYPAITRIETLRRLFGNTPFSILRNSSSEIQKAIKRMYDSFFLALQRTGAPPDLSGVKPAGPVYYPGTESLFSRSLTSGLGSIFRMPFGFGARAAAGGGVAAAAGTATKASMWPWILGIVVFVLLFGSLVGLSSLSASPSVDLIDTAALLPPNVGQETAAGVKNSIYINVQKSVSPTKLENAQAKGSKLQYTITIKAPLGNIKITSFENKAQVLQESGSKTFSVPDVSNKITGQEVTGDKPLTVNYEVTLNEDIADALLTDSITITAETQEGSQTSYGSASVIIGNPPDLICNNNFANRRYCFPILPAYAATPTCSHHDYVASDIMTNSGQPSPQVIAFVGGTILYAGSGDAVAGGAIIEKGDDGYIYGYYHLQSIQTSSGSQVNAGDPIGVQGETGSAKGTGEHTHFQAIAVSDCPFSNLTICASTYEDFNNKTLYPHVDSYVCPSSMFSQIFGGATACGPDTANEGCPACYGRTNCGQKPFKPQ